MENKKKIYAVVGPTASGKTNFSIDLAKKINGEIVSLDSIQVYKYLDIGSGKIKKEEMCGIKHYMIDVLEPTESFNIKKFSDMAKECIDIIYKKNKIPILVGGTGFYLNSILFDTNFEEEDEEKLSQIRNKINNIYNTKGIEYIYSILKKVDKGFVDITHINNTKRVLRAYEFYLYHNYPISLHNEKELNKESPYDFIIYYLDINREILYDRINRRVDLMIKDGLLDEIKNLIKSGVKKDMQSMKAIGYKELYDYVYENKNENILLDEIIERVKQNTRNYAKRQETWFKNKLYKNNKLNFIFVDKINL